MSAERADPVFEIDEPALELGVGPLRAVRADSDHERVSDTSGIDRGLRRADVDSDGACDLGDEEVRSRLDRAGQSIVRQTRDFDRDRGALPERVDRRAKSVARQHGRIDAVGNLAELVDRAPQALLGVVDEGEDRGVGTLLHLGTGEAERKRQAEQTLLRAVVQVSFEPTAIGLARCHDSGARRAKVLDPSQDFRMNSLIVEGETRCCGHLLDDGRVVEETTAMKKQGDRSALASERCLRQPFGDVHPLPFASTSSSRPSTA